MEQPGTGQGMPSSRDDLAGLTGEPVIATSDSFSDNISDLSCLRNGCGQKALSCCWMADIRAVIASEVAAVGVAVLLNDTVLVFC